MAACIAIQDLQGFNAKLVEQTSQFLQFILAIAS